VAVAVVVVESFRPLHNKLVVFGNHLQGNLLDYTKYKKHNQKLRLLKITFSSFKKFEI
jgi:hypothetical protein